ncbi:MAG: alkane 1-monooxygenase [Saprospiraceae bacterium]|nr:alkane 1-monooxygenase [Saprospiraceae bacterium]
MVVKDLKYLLAFIPSVLAIFGMSRGGFWTFSTVIFAFGLIPLLEVVLPFSEKNFTAEVEEKRSKVDYFDFLLYLNLPILLVILFIYFALMQSGTASTLEIVGNTFSVGIIVGTVGINVAHELGHRNDWFNQFVSRALLTPALYLHFNIEHNYGHHKYVATHEDPATARKDEPVYLFWFRAVSQSYMGAWKIEEERLKRLEKPFWSIHNKMIRFTLTLIGYLVFIGLYFSWAMVPYALAVAVVGFLLLETVNYVEHYGLRRKKLPSGRYETVSPKHSWNSDHEVGRIMLYELSRHSDHHYKATRKYQILRHMDESPQLPGGYPAAMLLSLLPPLWFRVMNPRVENISKA